MEQECERALEHLEQVVAFEGPGTIAAIVLETIPGTAGILVPPDGYLAGVREICDRHGIVYVADEVMAGFGRAGEWFAVDKWDVRPDLITFAKGSNSGYVPLGGVIISAEIADDVRAAGVPRRADLLRPPAGLRGGRRQHQRHDRRGHHRATPGGSGDDVLGPGLREIAERHPSVGEVRGLGVFWALDLVKDKATREMLVPYNASGAANEPMAALVAACKERGLLPFVNFNRLHVVPPCTITDEEAKEGLAILDEALAVADRIRHRLITGTVAPDELRHLLRPPRPGADVRGRARRGRGVLRERRPRAADRGGPRALGRRCCRRRARSSATRSRSPRTTRRPASSPTRPPASA